MAARETLWIVPSQDGANGEAGWEFGLPPGMTPEQWPRHQVSGLPLVHGFTLWIPEAYRVKGAELVGLSYFHPGETENDPALDPSLKARIDEVFRGGVLSDDEVGHAFWEGLRAHGQAGHPAAIFFLDVLDNDHAVYWHTADAMRAPRCPRPDVGELPEGLDGGVMGLDDDVIASRPLTWAVSGDVPYLQLGWPPHPVEWTPDDLRDAGFGDALLEIETEVGGANYGDGNCQIDLENDLLGWACT